MSSSSEIKVKLFEQCYRFCQDRLKIILSQIEDTNKALTAETKSSAGDKHETGRAMLQIEREKLGKQLAELEKQQEILSKIQTDKISINISLGSIVHTTQSNYFIAISAGKLQVNDVVFYGISSQTPIGKLLLGKTVGSEVEFNNLKFLIEKVS